MAGETIITGVIGLDSHTLGNRLLTYGLKREGFNVVNLGNFVSQKEFIDAAIETKADAILISSLYGHADLDCEGLRDGCEEAGLKGILLWLGGRLVPRQEDWKVTEARFKKMGFDRVFPLDTTLETVIDELKKDLGLKRETLV